MVVERWIGAGAAPDPAERAERAPSLVVSTAHSALAIERGSPAEVAAALACMVLAAEDC